MATNTKWRKFRKWLSARRRKDKAQRNFEAVVRVAENFKERAVIAMLDGDLVEQKRCTSIFNLYRHQALKYRKFLKEIGVIDYQ